MNQQSSQSEDKLLRKRTALILGASQHGSLAPRCECEARRAGTCPPDRFSSILPHSPSPAALRFLLADGWLGPGSSPACPALRAPAAGSPPAAFSPSSS